MVKEFSKEIISTFLECRKTEWTEKSYAKFIIEVKKHLKGKFEDALERSKLIVELSKFTNENKLNANKK